MEFVFNQRIVDEVARKLQESPDVEPVIINPQGGRISLVDRARAAANAKAELLLSIHHDAAHPKYFSDWEVNGTPHWTASLHAVWNLDKVDFDKVDFRPGPIELRPEE
jgi:N-acetylmuramoyl-L-alanine amidase